MSSSELSPLLIVRRNLTVWLHLPTVAVPLWEGVGRKPTQARVMYDTAQSLPVAAEGEKGSRLYDWAYQRIVENQEQLPGHDDWLLARRSTTKPQELAYYLSNALVETPLVKLAQVASAHAIPLRTQEGDAFSFPPKG